MTAAVPAAAARPSEDIVRPRDLFGYLAMVVGLFMAVLDIQIVASSIREIQAGISASLDEISWVQTSYLIAEVVVIPLTGWLARLLSTRWLFAISAGGFTIMSAASAFAWDINSMIAFRSLQGLFGGGMIPTVFSAIYRIFPPSKQTTATVIAGLVATMAPTLGPTLGGWITQSFSWHWLFLINLVPGLLVCFAVSALVRIDRPDLDLLRRIDGLGILLVAVFLGCTEYVLEEGPGDDWFESVTIMRVAAVGVVAGLLFLWRELRCQFPVVDLYAFRDRNFAVGCLFSFVIGIGLFGSTFTLPLFLSTVRGFNSLQIGLIMFVTGAFQFVSGPIAGALEKRLDLRVILAMGLAMFGGGLILNGFLTAEAGFAQLFLPQAIRGMAIMFCFLPITTLALGRLPREEIHNASGLYNLMRNLGGAIGIAAVNTVFETRYDLHYLRLAETVRRGSVAVDQAMTGLSSLVGPHIADPQRGELATLKLVRALLQREGTVMSYNDIFMMVGGVFLAALLLLPLIRKVAREAVVIEGP